MKTKILIAVVIFIGIFIFLKSISLVGIDLIPLTSLEWGVAKIWIMFYMVLLPSLFFAAIPFTPTILKKILGRSWEQ